MDQDAIRKRVERPDIWRPIRMAKTSRKGEQSAEQLGHLFHGGKGTKRGPEYSHKPQAQLDAVQEANSEYRFGGKAVLPQKIDKVRRREVQVDVFEAEQHGKDEAAQQQSRLAASQDKRQDEHAVHEAIVLEVDVVDDQEARGQDDGEGGNLGGTLRLEGARVDEALEGIDEDELGDDDGGALEVDGLPAVVVEVIQAHHERIDESGDVGEHPFEIGEEGRVVESPFRCLFKVPVLEGEALGNGEPIAMDFEVCRFAM